MLVCLLITLCTYTFCILELYYRIWPLEKDNDKLKSVSPWEVINWVMFLVVLVMTCWSMYKIVNSTPGYIPRNY